MTLALIMPGRDANPWVEALIKLDPSLTIQVYPEINNPSSVLGAILWKHPPGVTKSFNKLKWVSSLGAGVDHIINDPSIDEQIIITCIADDHLSNGMFNTLVLAIELYRNNFIKYFTDKLNKTWDPKLTKKDIVVGVMGVGRIGMEVLKKLVSYGLECYGYARSPKNEPGLKIYTGEELENFLSKINVLVSLLPNTRGTVNIFNKSFFSKLNPQTYFINVSRGALVVEDDLMWALDHEKISGAYLDVFNHEPLPINHPFWEHPRITIMPHVAATTDIRCASEIIVDNYHRLLNQKPLRFMVDRKKGY